MPIHPAVLIEAPVLGGDECLAHVNWDLRDGYIQSTDNREPTHEPAGAIEDSTAFVGMIGLNLAWTGAALESARAEPDIQCEDADDRRHQRHLKDQLTPIPDSSFQSSTCQSSTCIIDQSLPASTPCCFAPRSSSPAPAKAVEHPRRTPRP